MTFKLDLKHMGIIVGVVMLWRGLWGVLDLFLFPNDFLKSSLISLIFGLVILYYSHNLTEAI